MFLNLPLTEAGRSFLQCMLVMEGVPGRKVAGDREQSPRRLSRYGHIHGGIYHAPLDGETKHQQHLPTSGDINELNPDVIVLNES